MANKICFINQKGGVGKTTTTMQTAAYLTKNGKRVLMVDMDPQGNLTSYVGVSTEDRNTVAELLLGEAGFEETVQSTPYGDIVPSDEVLGFKEMIITGKVGRELLLSKALKAAAEQYDYVLVDCPPAINTFVYNVFLFVDNVVIVSEPGVFSAQGSGKLIETVRETTGAYDRKINVAGVLFTKNNNTKLADTVKASAEALFERHGVKAFRTSIGTFPAPIGESQMACQSLFDYAPKSKVTQQYAAAIEEILEAVKQ
ncbi:MAG: ParA family protein [Clostridia bacterium]|nr:ParA family protein [Clostridia bacterium]